MGGIRDAAEEAVRAYHGVLQRLGIKPRRALDEDLRLETNVMSYGGNGVLVSAPAASSTAVAKPAPKAKASQDGCACGCRCETSAKEENSSAPDFAKMTPPQKIAFHKARWDRILG